MKKRILLKIQLIVLLTISIQPIANACSCWPYEPVFCKIVNQWHNVVRVVVTEHIDFHLMEVNIIDNINNEIVGDTITIYGQDGLFCGELLNQFNILDTLILAVEEFQLNGTNYWYLEGYCGLHFLRYENDLVTGQISDSLTTQNYQDFKDNILECVDMQVSTEDVIMEESIKIFPNPVSEELQVISEKEDILGIDVFDSNGSLISQNFDGLNRSLKTDVSRLMNGIYFLRIRTSKGILTRKFIKIQ